MAVGCGRPPLAMAGCWLGCGQPRLAMAAVGWPWLPLAGPGRL